MFVFFNVNFYDISHLLHHFILLVFIHSIFEGDKKTKTKNKQNILVDLFEGSKNQHALWEINIRIEKN